MFKSRIAATGLLALSMFGVIAAPIGASAQGMATKTYEVTITNLASKQVLSPPIIATHPTSAHAWQLGKLASPGVKLVAEEGMNDQLAAELKGVATDIQMATDPLMPGKSVTLKIMAHDGDVLSAATMLVQTNDGFTGLDSEPLTGSMADKDTQAYDAGTEENTEAAADVPGPPFNGHNHGTPTNPQQPISMYQGIKGTADVTPDFNWSGSVARFSIHMAMGPEPSMGGTSPTTVPSTSGGTTTAPGMPHTGSSDSAGWFVLLAAAGALLLSGLALRRVYVRR
jgi:hypothetical protein